MPNSETRSASTRPAPTPCSARPTWSSRPSIRSSTGSRPSQHRRAVEDYRQAAASKSDLDRTDLAKTKTGVFTGAYATNPVNGQSIPVWIADYVLMGYGTGAIMAVPGHDERDFEFAQTFQPADRPRGRAERWTRRMLRLTEAEADPGVAVNSRNDEITLDGLPTAEAKVAITDWLEEKGLGKKTVNYKLRDWLFSRQRYWGEPFPVVLDANDRTHAVPESELPVRLPELEDFKPTGKPEPPLSKAKEWVRYSEKYRRETNTMPQWAGSCWYYLRYIDPAERQAPLGPGERTVLAAGGPLRRRGRARGAPLALQPVLAQGAVRPRAGQHARAVSEAGQPGDDPGRDRVHRLSRRRGALGSALKKAAGRASSRSS